MQNDKDQAGTYILQGMAFKRKELSYLKEGFRILLLSGKYEELSRFYRKLDKEEQEDGRLKLGYIQALHGLKQDKKALDLLESKGGLIPDDIRVGEDSLGEIWQELYESVYKKRENFRINLIFVRISIGFSDKSWYADYQSKKYSSVITAGNEEE